MGKSFAEKILAQKAGLNSVKPCEIVEVIPDYVLSHDNTAAIIKIFNKIGVKKLAKKNQPVIILDHCVPAASEVHARNHKEIRDFVREYNIKNFFDIQHGICHQVLPENGFVYPGVLLLGSDSHTTTAGAFGVFATGIGRSETAVIFATGKLWLRVPESVNIELSGNPPPLVGAKDIILKIIGDIGSDGALYKSVEFSGDALMRLSLSSRMVLANMSAEMGAKNAYVPPDERTFSWINKRVKTDYEPVYPDPDAYYEKVISYDVTSLEPMIACPHSVDNVTAVRDVSGIKIDQILLGTCTNGRLEDIEIAAQILEGKTIAGNTRLILFPASREVYLNAIEQGLLSVLSRAGATIMNPGCGPCLGAHEGILAPGEVCLSTSSRNFRGRMGCNEAEIYLSGPAVAAASALTGKITDPREIID